jgi:hypothetical protein
MNDLLLKLSIFQYSIIFIFIPFTISAQDLIETTHLMGPADGTFLYSVVEPDNITEDTYQISFSEYSPGLLTGSTGRIMDCSPSYVTGYAVSSDAVGTIDLVLSFELLCGGNWVDGIEYTFPEGFSSYINSWEFVDGDICDYGNDSGQNCNNLEGSLTGDILLFGTETTGDGFGAFESSNVLFVNVNQWYVDELEPLEIGYVIYDDGYDGATVNGEGTLLINEFYEFTPGTVVMNIHNQTTGELLLSTDDYPNEDGSNFNIIDGFRLYKGSVIYGELLDFNVINYIGVSDNSYFEIDSYYPNGWAETARAVDTWGAGISSLYILKRDIQIQFTGDYDYDNPIIADDGTIYIQALDIEGQGSWAWIDGTRLYDLENHPDPNNPGTGEPFRIRIPFEVWDMEAEGGPQQIDITIYDRMGSMNGVDTLYAFNPDNRMITHFIHLPYQADGQYGTTNGNDWGEEDNGLSTIENNLTWNLVWWETQFIQGDYITIEYLGPLSIEDIYVFNPNDGLYSNNDNIIPKDYSVNQNYPNPFNPVTRFRYDLPEDALVNITIYDMMGRVVKTLINDQQTAGYKSLHWNATNDAGSPVSAGIYLYMIQAGDFRQTKKMILLK